MKNYNWGILGTGFIAKKMADALSLVPQSTLKGIASRNLSTAQHFATEYHIEKVYGSYEALVQDPQIDIIYIATPHNLHYTNTIMALNHGKHVLCEKPFAVNGKELRVMMDCAREKNLFLMEGMWTRFLPGIIKAKEIIDSGKLGKVKLLTADFGLNVPFDPAHRLYNKDLVGGSLLDLGIYPLFFSLLMLGKPEAIHASAMIGATGVDYTCSFDLSYKNDVMAILYSTAVTETDIVATIYCEKGKIVFDRWWFMPVPFRLVTKEGTEEKFDFDFKGNGYQYEAAAVIQSLENRQIQCDMMNWEDSLLLMDSMDSIRKLAGIHYPKHDLL